MSDTRPTDPGDLPFKPYDASDPEAVERARRAEGRQRRDDDDVIRNLMRTREGRSWMFRFLTACHIYEDCVGFDREARIDVQATFFNLGMRNVGNMVLAKVQRAAPQKYVEMLTEGNSRG